MLSVAPEHAAVGPAGYEDGVYNRNFLFSASEISQWQTPIG